jgi:hypothetical protein
VEKGGNNLQNNLFKNKNKFMLKINSKQKQIAFSLKFKKIDEKINKIPKSFLFVIIINLKIHLSIM